ncbi:hypothetical protein HAX54_031845 [Datura stramonium]|uniref:Uncharacterized protein n=1 Tax=Datura stramonium TaxID=4076 RepID=A0ABS8VAL8_DATST|nr:hypothetical protein [Datura stramonium]
MQREKWRGCEGLREEGDGGEEAAFAIHRNKWREIQLKWFTGGYGEKRRRGGRGKELVKVRVGGAVWWSISVGGVDQSSWRKLRGETTGGGGDGASLVEGKRGRRRRLRGQRVAAAWFRKRGK